MKIKETQIILYVEDQYKSRDFYKALLQADPILDVQGMTEFRLGENCKLGLMPVQGIKRLLGAAVAGLQKANFPGAELYLMVDNAEEAVKYAEFIGAPVISEVSPRDWNHRTGYVADPDGYIIAFADTQQK